MKLKTTVTQKPLGLRVWLEGFIMKKLLLGLLALLSISASAGICEIKLQSEMIILNIDATRFEKVLDTKNFAECLKEVAVVGASGKSMQYLDSSYNNSHEQNTDLVEVEYIYTGTDSKYDGALIINR